MVFYHWSLWTQISPAKLSFQASNTGSACIGLIQLCGNMCASEQVSLSCTYVLQRGQRGNGLCNIDRRNDDLVVLSWVRMQYCALFSVILLNVLFILLVLKYVVTVVVVYMHFMFCLMCASVKLFVFNACGDVWSCVCHGS